MTERQIDVLVIGSGAGGMCAAAYLAHKGYKVLVTEALPRIGGHCSTIDYKGFKITTGMVGPGLGGPLEHLFREVGAEYNLRPCGTPHYLVNGKVITLPPKGTMRALLSAATDEVEEIDKALKAFSEGMRTDPPEKITMRDWLLQFTRNQPILDVFQTLVAGTGIVGIGQVTARGFFQYLKQTQGFREWGVCPEGSIALPKALAAVIEKHGGEVWTSSPAVRIRSQDGVVKGAAVRRAGEEIEVQASVVISNCGPTRTVDLAGRDALGRDYVEQIEELTPVNTILIHVGSDVPLIDYDYLLTVGAGRVAGLLQPTAVCPEWAPPGKHYLVVGADPATSLEPPDARKEIDHCIEVLKDILPEFESHAEVLMAGLWLGDWPAMHSTPGETMSFRTPIENLYAVGDGFFPEPGMAAMVGAAGSGVAAAKDIVDHLKPG